MLCPICQTWTMVKESRMRQDNTRRRALECANLHRFSTVERVEAVKHGGNRTKETQGDQKNND
jgi:transcriptional regulator NrdR family protein